MNRRDLETAIVDEVEEWPGVTVEFVEGGKHPKAKFTFTPAEGDPLMLSRPFASTPSTQGLKSVLGDMRRVMKQLGATRSKPEPSIEETEARYHKPNPGREMREHPISGDPVDPKPDIADQLVEAGAATADQAEAARAAKVRVVANDVAEGSPAVVIVDAETIDASQAAARIMEAAAAIVDGIYFDLPAEVYHAVPRLSASGIQRLVVSPATFWKGSWLDPKRPEPDEDATKAQVLGKAYHTARLEPHLFEALYCRQLSKADFPAKGTVWNSVEIGEALSEYGETKKRAGENVAEQAQRLEDCGFPHTIWPLEEARWKAKLGKRIPIPANFFDDIVSDMERLRGTPDIAEKLIGGAAEVSIFWTDRYGIKMKSRVDYLRPDLWDDFKTFDNSRGKVLAQALADALRYNRYHVQAVVYRDAVEAVRVEGLQIVGEATDEQRKLIATIQMRPAELACWFIFQEKNGIPNLLAREFPFFSVPLNIKIQHAGASDEAIERVENATRTKSGLHIRAIQDIDQAKRNFMLYSQVYEPGQPWAPIEPVGTFEDIDFNRHWLEGTYE